MKTIFLLSKENAKLAEAELKAVIKKRLFIDRNIAVCDCSKKETEKSMKRLAYTNSAFRFLFSCLPENLDEEFRKFDWEKFCNESYVLRKTGCGNLKSEKYYGSIIWNCLKHPEVDLNNAKTRIFLMCAEKIYAGSLISNSDRSYNRRIDDMKPSFHPTSTNPKLARAMVNLTGAEETEKISDPFCGAGGILVEAGLMGIKSSGMDISDKMLKFAKKNLERYNVSDCGLVKKDATKSYITTDYVVTDLPYGKNTKVSQDLGELYKSFLLNMKRWGVKKAVIGFPDFADYKSIIKETGFSIDKEFDFYLHKSLTKKIVVIK